MMVAMEIALVICLVAAVAALTWLLARRNPPVVVREPPPVEIYEAGSWGPEEAEALLAPHHWHAPTGHP